ncbi:hypothetical protein [Streptomyces cinereoruber]|uniref:hypothetical protein n=1 Tax=Streptomyces cinereoruber TaxID=67260 RepID=UPI00366557AB
MSADGELPGMWEGSDLLGGWADTDGTDARARLYAALMKGGPHSPDRSERASAFIDAFAHELAEKQRAWAQQEYDRDIHVDEFTFRRLKEQADLIDPAKEGERGQQ